MFEVVLKMFELLRIQELCLLGGLLIFPPPQFKLTINTGLSTLKKQYKGILYTLLLR